MKYSAVGDYINTMKTTFDLNFDLYQAVKQHGRINIKVLKRSCQLKSVSLNTCKFVIRKKSLNNQNLYEKVVFIVLI